MKSGHMITTLTKFEEKVREVDVQVSEGKTCRFVVECPRWNTYRKSKEKIATLTDIAND